MLAMLSVIFFLKGGGSMNFHSMFGHRKKKNVLLNRSKLSFTEST